MNKLVSDDELADSKVLFGQGPNREPSSTGSSAAAGGEHGTGAIVLAIGAAIKAGRTAKAMELLERGRASGVKTIVEARLLAEIRNLNGNRAEAIRELQIAIDAETERGEEYDAAKLCLANLLVEADDPARALAIIGGEAAWGRTQPQKTLLEARAHLALRDSDSVRRCLRALAATGGAAPDELLEIVRGAERVGLFDVVLEATALAGSRGGDERLRGHEVSANILKRFQTPDPTITPSDLIRMEAEARYYVADHWILSAILLNIGLFADEMMPQSELVRLLYDGLRVISSPNDTLGWIASVLHQRASDLSGFRGPEVNIYDSASRSETSRILNAWGLTFAINQSWANALLAFGAANIVNPEDQVPIFNLAHVLALCGLVEPAQSLYSRIRCIGANEGRLLFWPPSWPNRRLDTAAFESLKAAADTWPKISVVIPTLNHGEFIEDTLLSLINQNYPSLEIILIDGGSVDETMEIAERYRSHLKHVVSEPDRGQSDAINKGMAWATGDLLTWLNSDDMLAPGALHIWAAEWMRTSADVLYGICVTHRNRKVDIVNQPRAVQDDFDIHRLSDISRYWLKGHFFYQPEVIFSREIWTRTGGYVNTDYNYCMDFDLWLRFARAGARLSAVNWPVALFRYHKSQKTAQLDRCVQEQGRVRDTYVADLLSPERRRQISRKLAAAAQRGRLSVQVLSSRFSKIFSGEIDSELERYFRYQNARTAMSALKSPEELAAVDVLILLAHLDEEEQRLLAELKRRRFQGVVIGWHWDNHHMWQENLSTSELVDISIPGHDFCRQYLRTCQSILWPTVPLCVTQWSRREAQSMWQELKPSHQRSRHLYGGFVQYHDAVDRNKRLAAIIRSGAFPEIFLIDPTKLDRYFDKSRRERFREWTQYATSLCMGFDRDLSQRFFDALLAGQVPVCTYDIFDVAQLDQLSLFKDRDFVVAASDNISDLEAAHERALVIFEEGGEEEMSRRHTTALNQHMFVNRIDHIIRAVRSPQTVSG